MRTFRHDGRGTYRHDAEQEDAGSRPQTQLGGAWPSMDAVPVPVAPRAAARAWDLDEGISGATTVKRGIWYQSRGHARK